MKISLQEGDKEILEKMKESISSERPLGFFKTSKYNKNWSNTWSLYLNSFKISKKLSELGYMGKKSLILEFPTEKQVPNFLLRHFIRGYFDGDGCINVYLIKKTNSFKWCATIVSTENFCLELQKVIKKELNINVSIGKRHKRSQTTTRQLRTGGNQQVFRFLEWIYKDSKIFLKRKIDKFIRLRDYLIQNNRLGKRKKCH